MTEKKYPTPHIAATPEDFGKTVLMPGDPMRSEFIAKNFLENARMVNNVRGVAGYTGEYKGKKVSVMASGMGVPSMGIYSHELFNYFDVESIIRVGTAGAIQEKLHVRDVILAMGASTTSSFVSQFDLPGTFCATADFGLLKKAEEISQKIGMNTHVGTVLTADTFYDDDPEIYKKWKKMGVLAIEMETAALYTNAARFGKKALTVCTVSDHIVNKEYLSAEERRSSFTDMIEIALETAEA